MKRITVKSVVLLFLLTFMFSGCGDGDTSNSTLFFASDSFSFEVSAGSITTLTVLGVNGIIEVNGSATVSSVSISAVVKVGSPTSLADAQLHLNDLDVVVTELGTDVTVETVCPPGSPEDGRRRGLVPGVSPVWPWSGSSC